MTQYLELLKTIKAKGTHKDAARPGMPGTTSYFGYQFRHNLADGFPLLTTKELSFKNIIVELLWFMRGDTNIKYLVDNGCNIWNEDAYNYYCKISDKKIGKDEFKYSFEEFMQHVKTPPTLPAIAGSKYKFGDCGKQYGWLWRNWSEDQLLGLIKGLKTNPMGRRHIISAWNHETLDDMALNACHALVQFNCRPLTYSERLSLNTKENIERYGKNAFDFVPKYYLDCQMYQRSADVFLGVPYNIASYALLTELLAKMCGMIPGDFVHTFGDVHIYDNHMDAVDEQLVREPSKLPKLVLSDTYGFDTKDPELLITSLYQDVKYLSGYWRELFKLQGYDPLPTIKAKLSTGLQ